MKHDTVCITLDWGDAFELRDLLKRLNAVHNRAIQHFDIAPIMVTISEDFNVFKEEGFDLAKTLEQLNEQV